MAVIELSDVQAWLEQTKFTITTVDAELELSARTLAFSTVAVHYDTSAWTDETDTPELIKSIIAMLVAAWQYDRQYAEEDIEGSSYSQRLEERAMMILNGIADGTLSLGTGPDDSVDVTSPAFWPTDASTLLADDDPEDPDASPRAYTMGMVF